MKFWKEKDSQFRIRYHTFIYIGILFLFILLSLLVGFHHEPWADEANPWLIARDASFFDILAVYLHSEGHPALWYFIIKLFQMAGLPYSCFFLISLCFSTLGVGIFLFKSNFKLYLKLLLPFTYFIFYQYTIVARGYSLILFLFSLIAWIYPKRFEKKKLFTVLLILLLSLESYTYIVSGVLFLFYLTDYSKQKKKETKT